MYRLKKGEFFKRSGSAREFDFLTLKAIYDNTLTKDVFSTKFLAALGNLSISTFFTTFFGYNYLI
jgi:hypothetical protein